MSALHRRPQAPRIVSREEAEETTTIDSVAVIAVLALVVALIAFAESI
jgi:hypothetical protein